MKYFYIFIFIFIFSGCTNSEVKVQKFFQTDNATHIQNDYKNIVKLLIKYKQKLDLRNPKNSDKQFSHYMYKEFKNSTNFLHLQDDKKYIQDYTRYLKKAFEEDTKFRNDYLILGIYKQLWLAYEQNKSHQITALNYNLEPLKTLFYTLKVLKWKINTKKDKNENHLFLTWQNNWQIELQQRLTKGEKPSWELIENLNPIKLKQESLFSSSNPNFEILMSEMIYRVENSLKTLGEEPLDVSLEVMKSLVFFL